MFCHVILRSLLSALWSITASGYPLESNPLPCLTMSQEPENQNGSLFTIFSISVICGLCMVILNAWEFIECFLFSPDITITAVLYSMAQLNVQFVESPPSIRWCVLAFTREWAKLQGAKRSAGTSSLMNLRLCTGLSVSLKMTIRGPIPAHY